MERLATIILTGAVALTCIFPSPTFAEPEKSGPLDSIHNYGKDKLFTLTDEMDDFFGDIRRDEEKRNDWFRIGTEVKFRAADPIRIRERIRARLDLSDYAKNLRIFINGSSGDQIENGKTLEDSVEADDFITDYQGDAASTGISYDFVRTRNTLFSTDAGLKFSGGPHPFGDIRYSRWFDLGNDISLEGTQFLQWIEGDGFGEKTRLDLNRKTSSEGRVRNRLEALRSESSRGLTLVDELSYIQKFSDRSYAGISGSISAYTEPSWTPDIYKVALRYRERIYKDWLYLETEPALEFPNERDYRVTPSITFRLDMYFER